jgi:hypothetical protein
MTEAQGDSSIDLLLCSSLLATNWSPSTLTSTHYGHLRVLVPTKSSRCTSLTIVVWRLYLAAMATRVIVHVISCPSLFDLCT